MKIIDMLNKIANGENIKNIKYQNHIYEYYNGDFREEIDGAYDSNWLFANEIIDLSNLNDEVEIIEEEKELHANEIVFNCDNNKRECVITLDENDLGIDKLHMDNCYFYKENGKWYVKKYDFKTIKLEEEKKIPEKIEEKEIERTLAIGEQICANKINEIIDYLNSKGE